MKFEVIVIVSVALLVQHGLPFDLGVGLPDETNTIMPSLGTGPTINDSFVHEEHVGIHVASFKFDYVSVPLVTCLYLFVTALSKVVYHHADFLSTWVPESCILIVLGVIAGIAFHFTKHSELNKVFTPYSFFLFLLPPIILEASYSLHDRTFADNLGTILVFAVLGTLLNWAVIGPLLYGYTVFSDFNGLDRGEMSFVHCMTFSALISAVDPVAVLAIFEDIGVNHTLYFLVFGESLLNDAVTVVLYNMMTTFAKMKDKSESHIPVSQIVLGGCAFFTVSLGGLSVGVVFGLLSALILRYTCHVRVVEPMLVFLMAYMAYLCAEMFHWSGIISMIGCGLMQAQYAFQNISTKSYTTVKYFSKLMSAVSESVIFLFLGQALVSPDHEWQTGFVLWTLLIVFVIRFIVIFALAFLANRTQRLRRITIKEQFIMAYGGLRGAVSFALAAMLDAKYIPHSDLILTTTLTVILFTVFLQGATIRPLVKLLDITLHSTKQMSLFGEIDEHVRDHLLSGIEEIIGSFGDNKIRTWLDNLDEKYFKKWLQRNPHKKTDGIMHMFEKIALQQHYANLPGSKAAYEYAKKNSLVPGDGEPPHVVLARLSVDHRENPFKRKTFMDDLEDEEGGVINEAMEADENLGLRRRAAQFSHVSDLAMHVMRNGLSGHLNRVSDSQTHLAEQDASLEEEEEVVENNNETEKLPPVTVSTCESKETQRESLKDIDPQILRRLLTWKPDRSIHQTYDPNLSNEDKHDFQHQLDLKRTRTRKMSRSLSVSSRNRTTSSGSSTGAHLGSDERIASKDDNHAVPSWANDNSAVSSRRREPPKQRRPTPAAHTSIQMEAFDERQGRTNRGFEGPEIDAIKEEAEENEEEEQEQEFFEAAL